MGLNESLLKPCFKMHYPHLLIEIRHSQTFNINQVTACLRRHLFSMATQSVSAVIATRFIDLPVERSVIILHPTPVPPPKCNLWRPAVDFKYFPGECWHHPLEDFVAD
jgi:hypothetical protein